jgi:hypothetical protein
MGEHNKTYCKEISIYVIPRQKLLGHSPNFPIPASVIDLYVDFYGLNEFSNLITVLLIRDFIPDPDFHPSRILDPKTATREVKKN